MDSAEYFQFYENNKMGIKTADGLIIIPAIYDFVAPLSDGLFTITEGNYTAYFDSAGDEVLPFSNKYESYGNFTEGLARVMINEKWGFIDKTGKVVIQFKYNQASRHFRNGLMYIALVNSVWGVIGLDGTEYFDGYNPTPTPTPTAMPVSTPTQTPTQTPTSTPIYRPQANTNVKPQVSPSK